MKWSLLTNNFRGAQLIPSKVNKKWLLLVVVSTLFISFTALLLPKTSYADRGNNDLLLIGEHCHDLHDITHDFGIGTNGRCHEDNRPDVIPGWEEVLHSSLNCSDSMFYQHANQTDPKDASVTTTLWYTKQADYKDCYNKALAMYSAMSDPNGACAITKDGSDNNNKCVGYQNKLHDALGCDSQMFQRATVDGNPNSDGNYWIIKPGASSNCKDRINDVGNVHIVIIGSNGQPTQSPNAISDDAVAGDIGGGAAGAAGNGNQLGCDFSSSPLTWIVCPVVNMMVGAIDWIDGLITDQMNIKTQGIFCNNGTTCDAYYSAWVSFRNIALGLMVVAGLIVAIAQALGMEILDAYTIRKTLPRILIAAIAITLSWTLMNFAVTLSNDLGFGIRDLITAPFKSFDNTIHLDIAKSGAANLLGGTAVGAAAGVVAAPIWIAAGGLGVLLSYVATAGLAVLIAILVLLLRQVAVIMMILISPLALVAYILPNTQRIFRLWWESFTKALLMFPLIAAFIATGRVFSAISIQSGDPIHGFIGFIAYFAPYFLIPMTFRLSGGVMSGVGGFVQQRGQGAAGGLRNFRSNQMKSRVARQRGGGLYRGANRLTRGMNKLGMYTLDADEQIPYDLGARRSLGAGKYNPLGRVGSKLLGRHASNLGEQIASAATQHTAKGVEKADMHYTGAWAGMGLLDKDHAGSGLTAEGRRLIDKEYGTAFDPDTGAATAWQAPDNGDYQGLMKYASVLEEHSLDGSHAQLAGQQLRTKAGTLSSFGLDPETQRATLASVSALSAAKDGKLGANDLSKIYNTSMDKVKGDPAGEAMAAYQMAQLEGASTQQRQDLRRSKGIRLDEKGKAYSVYTDKKVKTASGEIEAYKTTQAKDSLLTAKAGSVGAGKGEYYDETGKAYLYHAAQKGADGEYTDDAKELRKFIVQQSGIYGGGDPGAKVKVDLIKERLGITPAEEMSYMRGYDAAGVASGAGEPPKPPEPPEAGGVPGLGAPGL